MPDKMKTIHVKAHERKVKVKDDKTRVEVPTYQSGQNPRPKIGGGVQIVGGGDPKAKEKGVRIVQSR